MQRLSNFSRNLARLVSASILLFSATAFGNSEADDLRMLRTIGASHTVSLRAYAPDGKFAGGSAGGDDNRMGFIRSVDCLGSIEALEYFAANESTFNRELEARYGIQLAFNGKVYTKDYEIADPCAGREGCAVFSSYRNSPGYHTGEFVDVRMIPSVGKRKLPDSATILKEYYCVDSPRFWQDPFAMATFLETTQLLAKVPTGRAEGLPMMRYFWDMFDAEEMQYVEALIAAANAQAGASYTKAQVARVKLGVYADSEGPRAKTDWGSECAVRYTSQGYIEFTDGSIFSNMRVPYGRPSCYSVPEKTGPNGEKLPGSYCRAVDTESDDGHPFTDYYDSERRGRPCHPNATARGSSFTGWGTNRRAVQENHDR